MGSYRGSCWEELGLFVVVPGWLLLALLDQNGLTLLRRPCDLPDQPSSSAYGDMLSNGSVEMRVSHGTKHSRSSSPCKIFPLGYQFRNRYRICLFGEPLRVSYSALEVSANFSDMNCLVSSSCLYCFFVYTAQILLIHPKYCLTIGDFWFASPSKVHIFVKNPAGRKICLRGVHLSDTLYTIKAKIQERYRLVFDGVQLEDIRTLADYGIQHDSTLDLQEKI